MVRRRLIARALAVLPIAALIALGIAALFLAGDAETDESRLARWSPWLYGGALVAVLVLLATIARQLYRLLQQRRAGVPGARLAGRWSLALILLAVPPVLLVYGFALNFLNATIDSWFNVRIDRALDDALTLGRLYLDAETERARASAEREAQALAALPAEARQAALDGALDRSGALSLALFADNGAVLASAAADPRVLLPTAPDATTLLSVRGGATDSVTEPLGEDLVVRVAHAAGPDAILVGVYGLPTPAQPLARNIEASWHDYQRLEFLRDSLKLTFTLILSAVLLLSLLLAVLVALEVARGQAAPIARLAAATQAIAQGRLGEQLPPGGDDELGFLTDSFNRMSRELDHASRVARDSQAETERQRAYLEAVLARLSSGVLTWDASARLLTANHAAGAILGVALTPHEGRPLAQLAGAAPELAPLLDLLALRAREGVAEWREELKVTREAGAQVLMLRAAALPPERSGASPALSDSAPTEPDATPAARAREPGAASPSARFVLVFDDQTVLNQAQREAAWAEVARRLAHEVKNPLTPIQLAAERVRHRLAGKLADADAAVLEKSTHTIVAQVDALKTLVNAFGDYARPPELHLAPLKLNVLVGEVLDLYEHEQHLKLARDLDRADPSVRADAGRLRQLLHNLLKNALEASNAQAPAITVATRVVGHDGARQIELEVADRGGGLPAGFDESWFEPYRTGKPKGTGLGLAVVRKVAEEHGGQVRALARDGGGARFVVTLPAI
jgi:nitrogen fixation/metabolism regulation signal transduction histidine kinase